MKSIIFILLFFVCFAIIFTEAKKHYSKEYEKTPDVTPERTIFRNLVRPFRMEKLNLIWIKAQHRLTEPKLQSLYTQMKIQDKEELQYKQNHVEADIEGIMAAKLRSKLIDIMKSYDLLEFAQNVESNKKPNGEHKKSKPEKSDNYKNKSLFKDNKLNKLWEQAEAAGLSLNEMDTLKQEFAHYQEKVDMYYSLLDSMDGSAKNRYENTVNEDELDMFNEVTSDAKVKDEHIEYVNKANLLRERHIDLKETYNNLEKKTADGRSKGEFVEPKVQNLWQVALSSNFTAQELGALKEELFHFESRLLKLSHMYAEHAVGNEKQKVKKELNANEKLKHMEKDIKKQARKVEKLQESLERQIYNHVEL